MRIVHPIAEDLQAAGVTGKCCFCDADSDAVWLQGSTVEVCRRCAVTLLPRLISDVARDSGDAMKSTWNEAELNYWRSIALRN